MRNTGQRLRMIAGSSVIAITTAAMPSQGFAQATQPAATAPLVSTESDQSEGEIIVTGSRISRSDPVAPNPVISLDSESIQRSGATSLVEYLREVPALVASADSPRTSGSAGFLGSTGITLLNLRNLGPQRTLVLVDGRRHVGHLPGTAGVDIGSIPLDLVERVEVATGGVSAIYGADAVSGVVNFIMKKDFEGLTGHFQGGVASEGSPGNWSASLVGGHNFADGRGNITLAYQYNHDGRLRARDRDYLRDSGYCTMQPNLADQVDGDDDAGIPDEVPVCGIRYFGSSPGGAILPNPFYMVRPDGSLYDVGTPLSSSYTVGGDGTSVADFIGDVIARNNRHVFNGTANFELSPAVKLFAEVKHARSRAFSESQPTFDYTVLVPADNPFISPGVLAQMMPGFPGLLLGLPPGAVPDGLLLSRDNFDLGIRAEDNTRKTWRTVLGLEGDLSDDLRYEVSYVFGRSHSRFKAINNRYNDRFFAALDVIADPVTGEPVCRSNVFPAQLLDQPFYNFGNRPFFFGALPSLSFTPGPGSGCVPLNLFGEGAPSQAAIDWIMTDSVATARQTQHVINGFLSGRVPGFELPGGPISFVAGAEWRRESSRSTPATEDAAGQTFGNRTVEVAGSFDVLEGFAEVRLPIASDLRFIHNLEATGALRFSDYSTIGHTTTWNLGLRWSPVRDLMLRGTAARTVRAPNINELFSPQSETFQFIDDPCDPSRLNNGSEYRAENCAEILAGVIAYTPNPFAIAGTRAGNRDLSEETAKSWTLGLALQPRFIPGLAVTLDWYDIKIKDAINQPSAQELADLCVDSPTIENSFCEGIVRNPLNGAIVDYLLEPQNVAQFRTAGLDAELRYRLDPARLGIRRNIGQFELHMIGNYLDRLEFIPAEGASVDDDRTEQYAPKWQATVDLTWMMKPLMINYGFNYFSKTKRYSLEEIAGDPDIASPENITFDAKHTHDLQAAIDVEDRFRFYAGVNNFTNQKPDLDRFYPVSPVGRFFYAGVRANFGGAN